MLNLPPSKKAVAAYRELADGLSDMVEEGRLREGDILDDYQWLVTTLEGIAALDPIEPNAESEGDREHDETLPVRADGGGAGGV